MFERFTDRARRVVVLAQEEARRLNHDYIGTEHLLLGLILESDGVAAKALSSLDISLAVVRFQVEEVVGRGVVDHSGHIPFTPRAKKVLELSFREALDLGHDFIGTEHLLLGLIREGEGVAAQVLQKLGADFDTVRETVIQLLPGASGTTRGSREAVAERAGVEPDYLVRLADLGILASEAGDHFSSGDVRRVLMAKSLEDAGIALEDVASAIQRGALSLDFLDAPGFERIAHLSAESFQQVSDRAGIPLDLLTSLREAVGMAPPSPDDRLREDEMAIVPFIELQVAEGFHPAAIERVLRVQGESTRRIADTEAAWWRSEVMEPAIAADAASEGISNANLTARIAPVMEQAVVAMYHLQQARAWTANIIEGFEELMARAGIRSRLERLPAICFLDITGYTRLTQEWGDDRAANLASTVARLVQRISVQRGGKTIKWLGDGVMFYFNEPGDGVLAALEMVEGLAGAELPPAHVGLHTGPVLFQEGDYFGQTVNLSARIGEYAGPGEVLVSQAVAEASKGMGIQFGDIGPVELKGVSGPLHLLRASLE